MGKNKLRQLRDSVNVEVAVLGSPSLTVLTVFANVTQNLKKITVNFFFKVGWGVGVGGEYEG